MSAMCPNCGKPVLPTDTACWHCGYALPKRPKTPLPARPRPKDDAPAEAATADYDLRALVVYGLLTLAVVLSLWLVMRALGQQPVLVRSAALAGGDWVSVTDADLRYTLSLPGGWQWLDLSYRDQQALLAEVIDRQGYVAHALDPLARPAADVETLAVAANTRDLNATEPIPFVVVGRSERLRDLSPEDALALLAGHDRPVTETAVDRHLAGQPQARFTVSDFANSYQCRHLFVAGLDAAGYLVAACAPPAEFGTLGRDLNAILDSFQLLQR
ncbi:MAG TPA: zinc ribbon domain-containing protein [Promineifilum sp.]|nr:zinc ribbon domain-containing protein [Promineifilum sp.]